MCGVKAFVILAVTAFNLSVMPWSERLDLFMTDPMLSQPLLKESKVR